MSSITSTRATFLAEGHIVSGSDVSGTVPISQENQRATASGTNEIKGNLLQINEAFNGGRTVPSLSVSSSVALTDASAFISLGSTSTSGNAQIRFNKADANNQTCLTFQNTGSNTWLVQHNSAEALNFMTSASVVLMAFVANLMSVVFARGITLSGSAGPQFLAGQGHPSGTFPNLPIGSMYTRTDAPATNQRLYWKDTSAWVSASV